MEWETHAIYLAAMVIMFAAQFWAWWRQALWQSELLERVKYWQRRAISNANRAEQKEQDSFESHHDLKFCEELREKESNEQTKVINRLNTRSKQLSDERNELAQAYRKAEQSRRALKGHNKRYRERIAELEGEQ